VGKNKKTALIKCPYFIVELLEINRETAQKASDNFSILSMLEGRLTIKFKSEKVNVVKGETVFLPAGLADYKLSPDIPSRMLKTYIPSNP
ncbi:unnamed protein product, partial [marine sediment metagenome]